MPDSQRKCGHASPGFPVRLPHNAAIANVIRTSDGQHPAIALSDGGMFLNSIHSPALAW